MSNYSIELKGLTKRFNDFTAVNNISFNVHKGELFGFLRPNGAGKTTTINMLATLLHPTSGTALINNYDIPNGIHYHKSINAVTDSSDNDTNINHVPMNRINIRFTNERPTKLQSNNKLTHIPGYSSCQARSTQ